MRSPSDTQCVFFRGGGWAWGGGGGLFKKPESQAALSTDCSTSKLQQRESSLTTDHSSSEIQSDDLGNQPILRPVCSTNLRHMHVQTEARAGTGHIRGAIAVLRCSLLSRSL